MDADGAEVGYVLYARHEKRVTTLRQGVLFDVSFKPGHNTEGLVDVGEKPEEHNSVEVQTTEENYFANVEIAISNDTRDWRLVRDRAPIYRFAADKLDGNQTVHYPPSRARYLRVRILLGDKQFPLTGVKVSQQTVEEAESAAFDAPLQRDTAQPAQQSWWRADMGHAHDKVSSVRFVVPQPEFHRAVRISAAEKLAEDKNDARYWRSIGEGEIYRYTRAGTLYEKLQINFPESSARYWRVEIFNRNDPELSGISLALLGTPRRVVFGARPGTHYRLVYGNPSAKPASYEMARLVAPEAIAAATSVELGAEEANTAYEDPHPLPWTERHPIVLWAAVLAAVAVLAFLAIRAMKTSV